MSIIYRFLLSYINDIVDRQILTGYIGPYTLIN